MNQTLADTMRRSLDLTRLGRLTDATAAIQAALSGSIAEQEAPASTALPPGSRIRPDAPDAEIVEPEIVKPAPRTARSTRQAPKRSLRDVIADLQKRPAAFGAMQGQPAAAPAIPEGARFDRLTHAGPHGSRGYRLYVPAALPDGPQGLVLMLHGCTQTADDFATGTAMNAQAERHGLIVVYPGADPGRERDGLLELVPGAGSGGDIGRSGAVGRPRAVGGARRLGARGADLRRRPLGRRRDGGDSRKRLPAGLRGGGRSFRNRSGTGLGHALGLCCDAR